MAIKIYNVTDLQNINNDLAGDYELANDIDAYGFGFTMLGYFTGTLDGKECKIIDLTITTNGSGMRNAALFERNYGTIKNLGIENCTISAISTDSSARAAALVYDNRGLISNCWSSGSISANCGGSSGWAIASGLVSVNNCLDGDGIIKKSRSGANCNAVSIGWASASGFVDDNYGDIDESYGVGNVSATSTYTGGGTRNSYAAGFVARNGYNYANYEGIINDCYGRGNAIAIGGTIAFASGFVAINDNANSVISKAYSTGVPTADDTIGGFCAVNLATITGCFWDIQTSGTVVSDGGIGKTTAQMKTRNTFTGWNFSTIWSITPFCNNGYPCLQNVTPNCALIPSIQGTQVKEIIALEAMRNLEMACGGRVYVDEEGELTYESRYARNP